VDLLPLVLSAHPSAWTIDMEEEGREALVNEIFDRDRHICRFCGYRAVGWQDVYHCDNDHKNWNPNNLVTACVLCHNVQHLGRSSVNREQILIWLPDMSQAALNVVVRRIHLLMHAHGGPAHMDEPPRSEAPEVHTALRTYRVLAAEAKTVERRIHTSNPQELGAALLAMPAYARARSATLLGGVRLLHRGRQFRNGKDVYPEILSAWARSAAPRRAEAA
jgi:intracellular multiplication protein IcmJ